jgi:hypothetical protein
MPLKRSRPNFDAESFLRTSRLEVVKELPMSETIMIGLRNLTGETHICRSCGSETQAPFNAEFSVSFAKFPTGLTSRPVYMVGQMIVCLNCGFAEVAIPQTDLGLLQIENGPGTLKMSASA